MRRLGPLTGAAEMRSRSQILSDNVLPRLVVVGGLGWSLAFAVLAPLNQLELYGDGAMFSYAVAVRDVWAYHWHNISGRTSVYLLTLLPAETLVRMTASPWIGITAYGFLFNALPLLGLWLTYAADQSRGRVIFVYACGSTALLCPLVFGFPTEMWLAHTIFWPALALSHYARRTVAGGASVFVSWLLLAFSHEGAFVLLLGLLFTLALRGFRSAPFLRGAVSLILILAAAVVAKVFFPPDAYYADAFVRAALHFFDPELFKVEVVILLMGAVAAYAVLGTTLSLAGLRHACIVALAFMLVLVVGYYLCCDKSIHASSRYYLRTVLVIVTPLLGGLAAIAALTSEGLTDGRLAWLQRTLVSPSHQLSCAVASMFVIVLAIHLVETGKFLSRWSDYRAAVTSLAASNESDPALGNPQFVSSQRLPPTLAPLAWFSTVPYLSVILSNFSPERLVIDPQGNYFWLSCETATRTRDAKLAVPEHARELVRIYSCLHR